MVNKKITKSRSDWEGHEVGTFDREHAEKICKELKLSDKVVKTITDMLDRGRIRYPGDESVKYVPLDAYEWLVLREGIVPHSDIVKRNAWIKRAKGWIDGPKSAPFEIRIKEWKEAKEQERIESEQKRIAAEEEYQRTFQLHKERLMKHPSPEPPTEVYQNISQECNTCQDNKTNQETDTHPSLLKRVKEFLYLMFDSRNPLYIIFSISSICLFFTVFGWEIWQLIKGMFMIVAFPFMMGWAIMQSCFDDGAYLLGFVGSAVIVLYGLRMILAIFRF